jgi:hypothetical protein
MGFPEIGGVGTLHEHYGHRMASPGIGGVGALHEHFCPARRRVGVSHFWAVQLVEQAHQIVVVVQLVEQAHEIGVVVQLLQYGDQIGHGLAVVGCRCSSTRPRPA